MADPTTPRQLAREAIARGDTIVIFDAKTAHRWLTPEAAAAETDRRLAAGEDAGLADRLDAEVHRLRQVSDAAHSVYYGDT